MEMRRRRRSAEKTRVHRRGDEPEEEGKREEVEEMQGVTRKLMARSERTGEASSSRELRRSAAADGEKIGRGDELGKPQARLSGG
jgi:hypothetical protein